MRAPPVPGEDCGDGYVCDTLARFDGSGAAAPKARLTHSTTSTSDEAAQTYSMGMIYEDFSEGVLQGALCCL